MYKFNPNDNDHTSVKLWFDVWEEYVQDRNFELAKNIFDNEVVSFGTWLDVVEGLDQLCSGQWKNIWPTINNFKFLTDTLFIQISPDRLFVNAILVWNSLGYDQKQNSFLRTGRATVTLKRVNLNSNWKGIHTHFSLNRGVPQQSFGNFN
jgi:hypothetical protein